MNRKIHSVLAAATGIFLADLAHAHVSVSGPAIADTTQVITFAVSHGCEGLDTLKLTIEIPEQIASLRTVSSDLGAASIAVDDAGLPVSVTWEKPEESLLESDTGYYTASIRFRVPNAPFTVLHFPAHQVCQSTSGETLELDWIGTTSHEDSEEGVEPAPALLILPKRYTGWNKFSVPTNITDLASVFSDAQIVWKGDAAYSPNPTTVELIHGTEDVTELRELQAGDEVWVKY